MINQYIKKTEFSYLKRGLYRRKYKTTFTIKDLMDLYLPRPKDREITIITYKNNRL